MYFYRLLKWPNVATAYNLLMQKQTALFLHLRMQLYFSMICCWPSDHLGGDVSMPAASQQTGPLFPQTQHPPWGCPFGSAESPWYHLLSLKNNTSISWNWKLGWNPRQKPQVSLNISLTHAKSADIEQALIIYYYSCHISSPHFSPSHFAFPIECISAWPRFCIWFIFLIGV